MIIEIFKFYYVLFSNMDFDLNGALPLYVLGYLKNLHKADNHVFLVHTIEVHAVHPYPSLFVRPEIMKAEFQKEKMKARDLENKYRMKMIKNDVSIRFELAMSLI